MQIVCKVFLVLQSKFKDFDWKKGRFEFKLSCSVENDLF